MDLVRQNLPNILQREQVRGNEILIDIAIILLASLLVLKLIYVGHRSIRRYLIRRRPQQIERRRLPVVLRRPIFRPE